VTITVVSIIVPCLNEEKTIGFLLDALAHQSLDISQMEIVIADGLSKDNTRKVIEQFSMSHPSMQIKIVDNLKSTIPAGVNAAAASASGKYLVRLDAHSIPAKDYVELCVRNLEGGKGDCVGGVWEIHPGREGWLARAIAAAAAHPLGVGDAWYRLSNREGEVDTVPFGAFRKSLFDELGGFNEDLLTNEDYEFYSRIRKAGGKIWLDPKIRCIYFARGSLLELARQYWRYGYWKFRMLLRFPETIRWRQALPPFFVSLLLFMGLASLFIPLFRLLWLGLCGIYFLSLLIGITPVTLQKKDFSLLIGMPLAIATMHLCWGAGFLYSMISKILFRK